MSEFSRSLLGRLSGASIISTYSDESLAEVMGTGGGTGTAVWPVANKAIFVPFRVQTSFTVQQIGWWNATTSGNADAGIYKTSGAKIASIGSTAVSGASTLQFASLSTTLDPGWYYMGLAVDNTTASFQRSGQLVGILQAFHVQEMASAFPLPATATFANPSAAYLPAVAICSQAVV